MTGGWRRPRPPVPLPAGLLPPRRLDSAQERECGPRRSVARKATAEIHQMIAAKEEDEEQECSSQTPVVALKLPSGRMLSPPRSLSEALDSYSWTAPTGCLGLSPARVFFVPVLAPGGGKPGGRRSKWRRGSSRIGGGGRRGRRRGAHCRCPAPSLHQSRGSRPLAPGRAILFFSRFFRAGALRPVCKRVGQRAAARGGGHKDKGCRGEVQTAQTFPRNRSEPPRARPRAPSAAGTARGYELQVVAKTKNRVTS